ncbi:Protein of unknown function [Gryllus bimaculatus]|nr:Protein of unknown function [Gryllus bimaculatus]
MDRQDSKDYWHQLSWLGMQWYQLSGEHECHQVQSHRLARKGPMHPPEPSAHVDQVYLTLLAKELELLHGLPNNDVANVVPAFPPKMRCQDIKKANHGLDAFLIFTYTSLEDKHSAMKNGFVSNFKKFKQVFKIL